jgi:hypothetical protein
MPRRQGGQSWMLRWGDKMVKLTEFQSELAVAREMLREPAQGVVPVLAVGDCWYIMPRCQTLPASDLDLDCLIKCPDWTQGDYNGGAHNIVTYCHEYVWCDLHEMRPRPARLARCLPENREMMQDATI